MQERTETLTAETLAAYANWSDARLLLAALQELPFTARGDLLQRLHEEVCLKADYCNNRHSPDFAGLPLAFEPRASVLAPDARSRSSRTWR